VGGIFEQDMANSWSIQVYFPGIKILFKSVFASKMVSLLNISWEFLFIFVVVPKEICFISNQCCPLKEYPISLIAS